MKYTLSITETDLQQLRALAFSKPDVEGAAFLLCGLSRTDTEVRFLCREVVPVADEHYAIRRPDFLSLTSQSFVPLAKRAERERLSIVFVHSHPGGWLDYSRQDDREEPKLQKFFAERTSGLIHGSLVLTEQGIIGRVWTGEFEAMNRIRVIGQRLRFHDRADDAPLAIEFFDRQVRAFGPEIQGSLARIHIGVVGAGGTGSPLVEELARLGIGTISVFDRDVFEPSNVNRLYGSTIRDADRKKVDIAKAHVSEIGLGTVVRTFPEHITKEAIAKELRDCDVVFGCTDKQAPRAILVQLALRYLIPVFDMGTVIDSKNGLIRDVAGRVTTLMPTEACLFCRGRISSEEIHNESLTPEERAQRAREGYAPELQTSAPAVIAFTTATASFAVAEFLHRMTGFMGADRESSEVLIQFDKSRIRTNRVPPSATCVCSAKQHWGRGDSRRFLDMLWAA